MDVLCRLKKTDSEEKVAQTTNELLEAIGGFRDKYTFFVAFLAAGTWMLTGIQIFAPAFISPYEKMPNDPPFWTVQEEFNLTTTWTNPAEWTSSFVFIGSMVFGQIIGVATEYYGRAPMVSLSCIVMALAGLASSMAPSFGWLLFWRFVCGAANMPCFVMSYLHTIECIPLASHSSCLIFYGFLWFSGCCIMSAIALLFPDWRSYMLIGSIPLLLLGILQIMTLPESLSFLIARRERDKIEKYMSLQHRFSGKRVKYDLEAIINSEVTHEKKISIREIMDNFFQRKILIWTIIAALLWITSSFVYVSMSFGSVILNIENNHIQFILSSAIEMPGYFIAPFIIDKFGRKQTSIWNMILLGVCNGILGALVTFGKGTTYYFMGIWLFAKLCSNAVFMYLFVYTSEIFPLDCRSLALGLCATMSNIGSLCSPHAPALETIFPGMMYVVFAILCISTSLSVLFLPETRH